jgi:archaellum component FlaC
LVTTQLIMKRLVITLSVLAVLVMISPSLPTLAQPTQVPHENPTIVTGSLDKAGLLLSYSKIIKLAADRRYQNAQDVLNELGHADIPDELRYITDRYRDICQQLFTTLDNLESLLDEASTLLARHQIHEAKQRLDNAQVDILDASSLLEDIEVATDTLSDQLGVFASPAASQISQAYARLEESIQRLRELIDELNNLWQSLTGRYVKMMGLTPTELSLGINPASVFVGDSISAYGRLSGDGKTLAKRNLTLTLDNKSIAASTGIDGSYLANITIPYRYTDTMTLTAAYVPSGDDTGKYLASQSLPVTINARFYRTLLEVSAPEIAYPGLPFTISGRVSSTDGNIGRTVRVLLDKTQLAEETVSGQFSLEVTPPEQASTGKHKLTVAVTPQGRYSGASETQTINISRLPIYIETQTPTLVILLKAIRINGRVYHQLGPVPDARVSLNFKDSSITTTTSPDGSFTMSLGAPLDLSLATPQELTMTVAPVEPWYATLRVKRPLFTINPISTGLILVILMALWLLIYRRGQARVPEEKDLSQAQVIELPAITPAPEPKLKLTGIKGRILSAYRGGLEAVAKITGVGMAPNITLREFLKMATLLSPTATGQFAELTAIAETALYSARSLRQDTAARAEELAATIKEELRRGTS